MSEPDQVFFAWAGGRIFNLDNSDAVDAEVEIHGIYFPPNPVFTPKKS
jgi:hypothetical protein